jgi:hypothetical protein
MLSNTLVTNEIKNAAGTEVEFGRISQGERTTEFAAVGETPSAPHRLTVAHMETGTGTSLRRRSKVGFSKAVTGQVDVTKPAVINFYVVADIPVGNLTAYAAAADVCAELMSFCASLGASTTILYDGTGNGAQTLINGTL